MARKECGHKASNDDDVGKLAKGQRKTNRLKKKKKETQFEKKLNINKLLKWRTRSKTEKSHWSWKYLHDSACSVKDVRTKVRLISNFFRLIIANKEHLKQYTHFFVKENRASALQFDTWPDRLGVNRPRCSILFEHHKFSTARRISRRVKPRVWAQR